MLSVLLLALWGMQVKEAGFYHDDAVTSDFLSEAKVQKRDAWSYSVAQFHSLVRSQGRLSLAYSLGITPFLVLIGDNLALYRSWHFLWTTMALTSLAWGIKRITGNWILGLFVACASLAFFATSTFHSSLVSYGVVLQQMTVFGFLGLGLACVSADHAEAGRVSAIASLGSLSLAVLTTEFGLVFIPMVVLLLFPRLGLRRTIWRSFPYLAIAGLYVVATFCAKAPNQYEGASLGVMQASVIGSTWLKQLSGTFPFSFAMTSEGQAIFGEHWFASAINSWSFWLLLFVSTPVFYWLTKRMRIQKSEDCWLLVSLGLILIVLPAAFTSISAKYQNALSYGISYVQVFSQYMGLAVLLAGLYLWLQRVAFSAPRQRQIACFALSLTLASSYAMTSYMNRLTIRYMNSVWEFPRENLGDALSSLDFGNEAPTLFVVDRPWLERWEWPPFAYRHVGRWVEFVTLAQFAAQRDKFPIGPGRNAYLLAYSLRSEGGGNVFVGKIAAVNLLEGAPAVQLVPASGRLVTLGTDPEAAATSSRVMADASGCMPPRLLQTKKLGLRRAATVAETFGEFLPASQ